DPMARIFCSGMNEWKLTAEAGGGFDGNLRASLQQRIDRAMATSINREVNMLERYMTFLGTVGSTAPFIGLFGTVWGIMNSFAAIAGAQNTSLAVVAPGIAEALFATALGLVAAIPAVVAYNKFSTDLGRYGDRLEAFSAEFSSILSRHFEQQGKH
ncbi:MAG: MotA/TolQ/ExbB proton channel family protein, partial [Alphaproteobacteria bacterium]|nr:MotA/TolQ/ExbB proton channel family protein [Alphaproteobacteria bacterium]